MDYLWKRGKKRCVRCGMLPMRKSQPDLWCFDKLLHFHSDRLRCWFTPQPATIYRTPLPRPEGTGHSVYKFIDLALFYIVYAHKLTQGVHETVNWKLSVKDLVHHALAHLRYDTGPYTYTSKLRSCINSVDGSKSAQ